MSKKHSRPLANTEAEAKEKNNPQVLVAAIGSRTTIIVAVIGLIGTLAGLYFSYIQGANTKTISTLTPNSPIISATTPPTAGQIINTAIVESPIPTTAIPENIISTSVTTQIPTATNTLMSLAVGTSTQMELLVGMDVQLVTDITSGRHPLTVNFDARGSFLRDANGDIYNCGVCNYTWYIYQNFQLLNEPQRSSNGTFRYRFTKDGEYRVVVKVCRGQGESDCGYDAEEITVR